jgi:hypothetical protein
LSVPPQPPAYWPVAFLKNVNSGTNRQNRPDPAVPNSRGFAKVNVDAMTDEVISMGTEPAENNADENQAKNQRVSANG